MAIGINIDPVGGIGSLVGAFTANDRRKKQMRDQKKLMEIQTQNQMKLNEQGSALAKENWDYTNAENQVKHYENAGLNVGLMYGGSGAGGTLSSGSGGSASGGTAPIPENPGIMGIQLAQLQSQVELNKAMANKANAEAEKTSGIDTELGGANKALTEMKTKNEELQNTIGNKTLDEVILGVKANADIAQSKARQEVVGANITEQTKNEQIDKIKAESINEAFKLAVAKSGIDLNEAQMNKMLEDIKIGKANAEKITTDQVAGKQLNSLIEKIYDIFGIKNETLK